MKTLAPIAQFKQPKQSEYTLRADKFLADTGTIIKFEYLKHGKHFADDKQDRDIYVITISRGSRSFTFQYGASIIDSGIIFLGSSGAAPRGKIFNHNGKHCISAATANEFMTWQRSGMKIIEPRTTPSNYDILACLTKYDVGTFEDFCGEFGYDTDSKKAEKTYNAVREEWINVQTIWTDAEIEQLQEIQ